MDSSDRRLALAALDDTASLELARLVVLSDGDEDEDDGEEWMAETASLSTWDTFSLAVSSPTSSQSPVSASFFRNLPGGVHASNICHNLPRYVRFALLGR